MDHKKIEDYNYQRELLIKSDRRFSQVDNKLCFSNCNLEKIAKEYGTPLYVYSENEILENINEINQAFSQHPNTKQFFASKACSVMSIIDIVRRANMCIETNSLYEIMKAIKVGFKGEQIVFNGVVKKERDLEYAIDHDLYLINVDSLYELDLIDKISQKLQKTANVCVRVEPNVPSATHPELVTAYHAKSGLDLEQAEETCRRILKMPFVHLKGLHMHVGDQVPEAEPFAKATKVLVDESRRLEEVLNIKFDLINVGGGIPTPYKYDTKGADPLADNMYAGINAQDFANAIISEVHKWRSDIEICVEPGRKVVGSAAVLLTELCCEKTKTNYDEAGNIECLVDWKFVDAGYSHLSDSLHFDWFFYLYNASKINSSHNQSVKIAGPLCDGGDYFHMGVSGEYYLLPEQSAVGDIITFIDVGAYSIESQTVYNNRPRSAVALIDKDNKVKLIRREDSFDDIIKQDIY